MTYTAKFLSPRNGIPFSRKRLFYDLSTRNYFPPGQNFLYYFENYHSEKVRGHDNVFLFIYLFVCSQKSIAIFPPISVSYCCGVHDTKEIYR